MLKTTRSRVVSLSNPPQHNTIIIHAYMSILSTGLQRQKKNKKKTAFGQQIKIVLLLGLGAVRGALA